MNQTQFWRLSGLQAAGIAIALFGMAVSAAAAVAISLNAVSGPLQPDPARGLVVPFHDHTVIHYGTQAMARWLAIAVAGEVTSVLLGLVIGLWISLTRYTCRT